MKKQLIFVTIIFIAFHSVYAQNIGVGQWEDYLSYKSGLAVAEGGGKVYCATKSGIFLLNKTDKALQRLSKINGLSDIEATVLGYNTYSNKLFIGYKNSNIDIIDNNNNITNLSDIKRKPILGNKLINNVYFSNQYAYLACGFGIVVVDMNRLEIHDTYYIGPNGNALDVYDITTDNNYIYAATDDGIYKAIKTSILANYANWSKMTGLPNGVYNSITEFHGKLYTCFSKYLTSSVYDQDTCFVYDYNAWNYFDPATPNGNTYRSVKKQNNNALVINKTYSVGIFDSTLTLQTTMDGYFGNYTQAEQVIIDGSNNKWIADENHGLVYLDANSGLSQFFPDGPNSPNVIAMDVRDNKLVIAPGGGSDGYFNDGIYTYNGSSWHNINGSFPPIAKFDTMYNISNVLMDPNDNRRIYATTGYAGVMELYDGVPVKIYNQTNSSLQQISGSGNYKPIWTSGLTFDGNSNLWITNSGVSSPVSVKKNDGTWQSINFLNILGTSPNMGQIMIDHVGQKWIVLPRGEGLMVYNGYGEAGSSSNTKKFSTATGNGALPSLNIFCVAEDLNGEIWVGTDKGVTVFYTPENVFSGDNFDSQQILIEQDGHVQILLETEQIQCMAVDGANRKWFGTLNSGVFLMSPDGITQIHHFDITNSPLFSNEIKSITINQKTGEVYFGTSKGIISYRGTATQGGDSFSEVYSFPNPVKHEYDGPIAIKGLVTNSIVKITDITGTLVYQMVADGGQAVWDGKNFNGQRVSTGVYMVFAASSDGSQKMVTKILFLN